MIFGSVSGSAIDRHHLLAVVFNYFNIGVFVLAVIIIIYTLIISVINTAHQGEFLGKKLDSLWVPIRSVLGIALVLPMPSGYSIIQVFMMWMVVQGVGLADTIWTQAVVQVFSKGTPVVTAGNSGKDTSTFVEPTKNILSGLMCMQQVYRDDNPDSTSAGASFIRPERITDKDNIDGYYFRPSGTDNTKNYANCGYVEWKIKTKEEKKVATKYNNAVYTVINYLNYYAKGFVYNQDATISDLEKEQTNPMVVAATQFTDLVSASDGLNPTYHDFAKDESKDAQLWKSAISYGWANAGAYYYHIATANKMVAESTEYPSDIEVKVDNVNNKLTEDDKSVIKSLDDNAAKKSLGKIWCSYAIE